MTIKELHFKSVKKILPLYSKSEASYILNIFLCEFLNINKLKLSLSINETATEELQDYIINTLKRLLKNEPFQYILGNEAFYGYTFKVTEDVLIPRPETEELVEWVMQTVGEKEVQILDIGTGSACIPISLSKELNFAKVSACDISLEALKIAEENNCNLDANVFLFKLDILNEKLWQSDVQYDVIVSNPPYIPNKEKALMSKNVLNFEPELALFVKDDDALIFYEKIADYAKTRLSENGFLFFECNEFNAKQVLKMLEKKQYSNIELRKDLCGRDRMIKASFT